MKLKRIMAMLLCVAMVLSTMSFSVFAEEAITVGTAEDLKTAISDAEPGATIELGADIDYGNEIVMIDKSLTINGNGNKIISAANRVIRVTKADVEVTLNGVDVVSDAVRVEQNDIRGISIDAGTSGVTLTLNNCSVDFTDASACDWAYAVNQSGTDSYGNTIKIIGGSYEGANVINIWGNEHNVIVEGATLTSLYPDSEYFNGNCIRLEGAQTNATVKNTTFEGDNAVAIVAVKETSTFVEENNTDKTQRYVEETPAEKIVATVGDEEFTDLQEAIKFAAPAGTVEIIDDVVVDEWIMFSQRLGIGSGQIITLDMNGLTIKGNGKTLTVNSVESATNGDRLFHEADNLNIENLTINYADGVVGGISLKSGELKDVTINGGVGVLPGTGDITITGCEFNTNGSAIYNEEARDNLVVTGNTFNTTPGQYSIYLRGNTTFTNNTVVNGKVNVVSGSPVVTGNDFGNERFKVYNASTATIEENKIIVLEFNDASEVKASFSDNTLSEDAKSALKDAGIVVASAPVAALDGVGYPDFQSAYEAAEAGDTITMASDIIITKSIDIKKNITLDLNGKTIEGIEKATGSFGLINVHAGYELTIEDSVGTGKITLTAANDRDWNAYSSVVSNQRGKLTVNGGTIEHLGGTDMAYGIDNLTNGKGTYAETVINGGTVKSTYRAVRQFLNGTEADNILTINGGIIEGANKAIWMQDPSKNANTGTLTITENAKVNGDVYLFVTAGSTEWPVVIDIATSAVTGEILTANVPEGYELVTENGKFSVEESVIPAGTVTLCYTSANAFWGEAGSNAVESFVIKLFEGDKEIASASLNDINNIIDGELYVTWNIPFAPNNDGYWNVEWAEGYPKYDMNPTAVKLFSDGVEVAENVVKFNAPDDLKKIVALAEDAEGNVKAYENLKDAVESATKVSVVRDTTLTEDLTLPAGITFNGNGKNITGTLVASGDVTFAGHTKVTNFNAGYNKPVVTIGEGACLELTGTGRMVIGHGATFNITGTIENAKTAANARAIVEPSLIMLGASFTGAGVNFNVKNAYISVPSSYCSSSKSASGIFNFNIENSIWEVATNKLAFEAQSVEATVNFNLKDSVINTAFHLIFGVDKGEIIIDNSIINDQVNNGTRVYKQLENRSTMTIKNGSVVYASVATSDNAKNPGKLTVDNATFISTGTFTGADLGTGTLILINGANFTTGTLENVNATVDATSTLTAVIGSGANVTEKGATLAGTGTEGDPYIIADLYDLEFFRDSVNAGNNYAGKYVELTADIDLKGENWTPIGTSSAPFNGNFNGNDKTISNLVINGSKTYVSGGNNDNYKGFFGYSKGNNTVIENITIENAKVTGCLYVGALIGRIYTGATIKNCHITGEIDIDSYSYAGGLVGRYEYASGIYDCSVKDTSANGGTVNADYAVSYVGGIVGFTTEPAPYVTIDGCEVENMAISGIYGVGGLAGISHQGVTISNAVVNKVTVISDQTGYDDTNREGNVGLVAGACQGTATTPSVFENVIVTETTGSVTNEEGTTEVKDFFGSNMTGVPAVTNYVAKVGSSYFASLESAFKAATSGCVIELLADATISDKWDCRYNGAKFLVPVTIEGNNKTIKLTGEVNDANWNTVFRFEDNATVKNLTIDVSEATSVQRAISSKLSITADNVKVIGNATTRYGIIFGEGAGTAISDITATITNSEFTNCKAGVSDNANGQDAKAVTITGSKFNNSNVIVSASEIVTFTGNEVECGYVNISSYSVPNELSVTAKENILDTTETYAEDNTISAQTIDAQEGFITPVAIVDGKYYSDLQSAIDKANGSTITLLDDMTLVDTTYTIEDGMALTLDLNGKTITATENKTGNYELFYNFGELTVVGNGSVELTATVDRDWNALSAIFHNRGGVLNLENGTFTHKGGTDMAYVVDNSGNSFGDATTNIKDGSLSSTYIAIRNRMDTYGANGGGNGIATLNVTGGSIYGYRRGIWGQVSSTGAKGNINISGGSVTSVEQDAVVVGTDATGEINTAISGGTFSSDVSAFLVDGASISKNADGTYGVVAERAIEVSASKDKVVAGEEFTVTVKFAKGENIFNAAWTLSYETDKFELKDSADQSGTIKGIIWKTFEGEKFAQDEVLKTYTFVAKAVAAETTGNFALSETTASTFAESRDDIYVAAVTNDPVPVTIMMKDYEVSATLNGTAVDLTAENPAAETTYNGEAQKFVVETDLPEGVDYEIKYTVNGEEVEEVALTNAGDYEVVYTITTENGYANKTGKVTITVNDPDFVVETSQWTNMGKRLVLVYTKQENLYFTYNGNLMIDVTEREYKYENTEEYPHVFAFVTDVLAKDEVDSYRANIKYLADGTGLIKLALAEPEKLADINFSRHLNVQDISVEYGIVNLHSEIYGDVKYQKHLLKGDTNGDKIVNGKDTAFVVSEVKTALGIN